MPMTSHLTRTMSRFCGLLLGCWPQCISSCIYRRNTVALQLDVGLSLIRALRDTDWVQYLHALRDELSWVAQWKIRRPPAVLYL